MSGDNNDILLQQLLIQCSEQTKSIASLTEGLTNLQKQVTILNKNYLKAVDELRNETKNVQEMVNNLKTFETQTKTYANIGKWLVYGAGVVFLAILADYKNFVNMLSDVGVWIKNLFV